MNIVNSKQIELLVELARKDGNFAEEEKKLIEEIARKKNINEQELSLLLGKADQSDTSLGALSQSKKVEYLVSLVELTLADNNIAKSEVLFCQNMALKMGFKKEVVDDLIRYFLESDTIEAGRIRQIADKYSI